MTPPLLDVIAGFTVNFVAPCVIIKRAQASAIRSSSRLAALYLGVLVIATLHTGLLPATLMDPVLPWWGAILGRLLTRTVFALALAHVVLKCVARRPLLAATLSICLPLLSETSGRILEIRGRYEFWQYCSARPGCLDPLLESFLWEYVNAVFLPPLVAGCALAVWCAFRWGAQRVTAG